jgi:hypothetical protein
MVAELPVSEPAVTLVIVNGAVPVVVKVLFGEVVVPPEASAVTI